MAGVQLIYDTTCTSTSGVCCQWTVPTGTYAVTFEVWGGGGGGGTQGTSCDCCQRGGPGAGGGYSKKTVATVPGCQYTICAGPGGVSSQGWGSYCGRCCNGCAGGTSFVTGYNVPSSFCATGGAGGPSDFNTNCYAHCGCNFCGYLGGCGFNGDTMTNGNWGVMSSHGGQSPYDISVKGGDAGGIGGGAGGVNAGGGYADGSSWCAQTGESQLHGRIPGGGGAGSGGYTCCQCTPWASGRGAPGLVKISY